MKRQQQTLESRVADEVLQHPASYRVGNRTYLVAKVTPATIILAAEAVAEMLRVMSIETPEDAARAEQVPTDGGTLAFTLANPQGIRATARVGATLLVGAQKPALWGRLFLRLQRFYTHRRVNALTDRLLHCWSFEELFSASSDLLGRAQTEYFFALTTFLMKTSETRRRKVEDEATASGRS